MFSSPDFFVNLLNYWRDFLIDCNASFFDTAEIEFDFSSSLRSLSADCRPSLSLFAPEQMVIEASIIKIKADAGTVKIQKGRSVLWAYFA